MHKLITVIIFAVLAITGYTFTAPQNSETLVAAAEPEAGGCRIAATGATVKKVQAKVGVAQDGAMGPVTCNAIKAYQCTKNLSVDGVVGPMTWGVMNGNTPPRGTRICADLRNQKLWLTKNGVRTYTAERMRSGDINLSRSEATKTGNHTIYWKNIDHVSSIFGSPMPYAMFFYGGQAIHQSSFSTPGSHGCINVTHNDAKKLWNNAPVGTPVSIWGARQ